MGKEIDISMYNQLCDNTAIQKRNEYRLAIYDYVSSIALGRFTWDIPQQITTNQFTIENSLLWSGYVAFVQAPFSDDFYILPCQAQEYNIFSEPTKIVLTGIGAFDNDILNLIGREHYKGDFILCYNSLERKPKQIYMNCIINDLAEVMYIQSSLYSKLIQPYVVETTDKKLYNDKQLANRILNRDIVFTDTIENIKVLKLEIETEHLLRLQERFDDLMRRLHGLLGLAYDVDAKRERLITDEQIARNEIKEQFTQSLLNERQRFCDTINEKYGLNISVQSTI